MYGVPFTHYPSWGSETVPGARWGHSVTSDSLPLMGIGNLALSASSIQADSSSLPLMGIGNALHTTVREPRYGCSLPLMGIGNTPVQGLDGLNFELITPHGDRKRIVGAVYITPPSHSLPLMGIGNKPYGPGKEDDYYTSLPLMGIGN